MSRVAVARTQLSRVGVLPALRRMAAADIAALGYSSQLGQDVLVDRLLGGRRNGVFVDVGAHDGTTLSNSLFFERERGWKGLCVEASPAVFPTLQAARTATCVNVAIGARAGTADFTMIDGDAEMLSGLTSGYSRRHRARMLRDSAASNAVSVRVPVRRLDDVLREHGVEKVDMLSVDVEGGEVGVLDSLRLADFRVEIVVVENNYSSRALRRRMWRQGYQLLLRLGWDDVFVPRVWTIPSDTGRG